MRKILFIILFCQIAFSGFSQVSIKGIVMDSLTGDYLPGVNISIGKASNPFLTNIDGYFETQVQSVPVDLFFSYISYNDKLVNVSSTDTLLILMTVDEYVTKQLQYEEEIMNKKIHNRLDIGYFADIQNAPYGAMINYSLQSIYGLRVPVNMNGKYWTNRDDSKGYEFSVNYDLTDWINYLPDNLHLAHTRFDYKTISVDLTQTRGMLSNEWRGMAFDYGVSYNQPDSSNKNYVALVAGFSYRPRPYLSFFGNIGFHADINYHPDHFYYSASMYKEFWIKNFTSVMISAKYFNFDQFDGLFLSLSFGLFNTRYYCCSSWKPYYHNMNTLK